MKDKVEKAINHLLQTNPFYAHFFLNSKIAYDKHQVPTAGVTVVGGTTYMVFNTQFVNSLSPLEISSLIEHETLHLVFGHLEHFKSKGLYNPMIANMAQDLSINQYLKNLPPGAITLEGIEKAIGTKLEPLQNWEYYYGKLIKYKDDLQDKFDSMDDHDFGDFQEGDGDGDGLNEVVNRRAKGQGESNGKDRAAIADTIGKSIKGAAGNVPECILKAYDALKSEHKVPWQQVLANFVSRSLSTTTLPTRKKRNRRFGLDQPGKKKKRELTLGVCVDSSGSVSDHSYEQFMSELIRISKICRVVHFVEADCAVQNVDTIKKNKEVNTSRRGCGGTAYQPAIDKCVELKCDAIVYFGDFDCADTPLDPGIPFLWVGVGDSPKPGNFGSEIRI